MSFSPALNVVVLGGDARARGYFAALAACRIVAQGAPVSIAPMIWAETRDQIALIAGDTRPILTGTDLADMLAADIHVAIVASDDPALLRRAIEARKHVLVTGPVEADLVVPARLVTGIASSPADVRLFLEGLLTGRSPLAAFGRPIDPAEEVRLALAVLPAEAGEARIRLERALALLEGSR